MCVDALSKYEEFFDVKIILATFDPLEAALRKIDINGAGSIFVVDDHANIHGIISNEQLRESLRLGLSTEVHCGKVMKKDYFALRFDEIGKDVSEILEVYKVIPVVLDGRLIDVITSNNNDIIPISKPKISGNAEKFVMDCIRTGWVSSLGSYVKKFEAEFEKFTGLENAISVCNGTVALELALLSLGVGLGDEVIVPNLTFGATVNSVLAVGATPVLVDVDVENWLIDPSLLLQSLTTKTKAVILVDLYGLPADVHRIRKLLPSNVLIVQDSAEALGATTSVGHTGLLADAVTFSFFANKIITCGEGGIVCFRNHEVFEIAQSIKNHGMDPNLRYCHINPGRNYRMTNVQAAIGLSQLEDFSGFWDRRTSIFETYEQKLSAVIEVPKVSSGSRQSPWLFTCVFPDIDVEKLINYLSVQSIDTRRVFSPMNEQPAFRNFRYHTERNVSKYVYLHGISLPTYVDLSEDSQQVIIEKIQNFISGGRSV